jgi:hypothetical protein
MTTITVTDADQGITIAQNGTLSAIRYLVSGGEMYAKFIIADDSSSYVVPKQIYCSDCLDRGTNRNGFFQSPYGVLFEDQSIAFGNLTVLNCPRNSKFEIDCTGALPLAAIEEARRLRDQRAAFPPPPPPPPEPENGYWSSQWCGPGSGVTPTLTPQQIEAEARIVEAWRRRRDSQGVRGPSPEERETERLISERRRAAEERAGVEANAATEAKAEAITAARAKGQAEATALLAKASRGK